MIKTRQFANAITGSILFSLAYLTGLLIYWEVFPYQTAHVDVPVEVLNDNNQVKPGEDIQLIIIFDKQSDYAPKVDRNIICNTGNTYQVETPNRSSSRPRGRFVAEVDFELSDKAIPSEICVFEFINTYQVNPIRTVVKKWQSEPFEVIE